MGAGVKIMHVCVEEFFELYVQRTRRLITILLDSQKLSIKDWAIVSWLCLDFDHFV